MFKLELVELVPVQVAQINPMAELQLELLLFLMVQVVAVETGQELEVQPAKMVKLV